MRQGGEPTPERRRGWIKVWRRVQANPVFQSAELFKLFMVCLLRANHTAREVVLQGVVDPIVVQPGQFVTGRRALHRAYYPEGSEANPAVEVKSPRTVWRWLQRLERWGLVRLDVSNRYTLVTVVNWEEYQGAAGEMSKQKAISVSSQQIGQPQGTAGNSRIDLSNRCPAGVQPMSTNKNVKEWGRRLQLLSTSRKNAKMDSREADADQTEIFTPQEVEHDICREIFNHWRSHANLIQHRRLTAQMRSHIQARRQDFTVAELKEAISEYSRVLASDRHDLMTYRWELQQFLKIGEGEKVYRMLQAPDSYISADRHRQERADRQPYTEDHDPQDEW